MEDATSRAAVGTALVRLLAIPMLAPIGVALVMNVGGWIATLARLVL